MEIRKIDGLTGNYSQKKIENTELKQNTVDKNRQIKELPNIYYQPVSFGRSKAEHNSWGAKIDPKTKEASFKILTYPDTKGVTVTVEKRNNKNKKTVYELQNKGNGIFETSHKIPAGQVEHGDKYYYTIYKGNGDIDKVKDPYSFRQEKLLGESTIYDHSLYQWNDNDWFKNSKERISRRANNENGLTPLDKAAIYEFNTASFTKRGDFEGAKKKLQEIKQLGFNSIEIMPVENTYSFNWGYDGVDKMAPAEHLGGPDGLKSLIDEAHNTGLNVIMDMVPNHLGPDGASLLKTGPFIKGNNCFGEAFNYEGENSRYVRDYMVNAALNWLNNYHCDGLRLDMTKFMESDYTMKQIAAEVNYHNPDAFLIAEDARDSISVNDNGDFWDDGNEVHDRRVVNPLKQFESAEGQSEHEHINAIEQISNNNTSLGRLGYDSEWDFNYFHTLKDGLYGIVDLDKLEKACYASKGRVKYIMSHDEIGNFEGSRLVAKLLEPMLHLRDNIILDKNDLKRAEDLAKMRNSSVKDEREMVKSQKAQFTSEKIAILLQTGALDKYKTDGITSVRTINRINKAFNDEVLTPLGIKHSSGLNYDLIKTMYIKCMNKNEMALALTYALPGPTMVFQGDEKSDLTPFRFFREFDSNKNEVNIHTEKGYNSGKPALKESTMGNIKYSQQGKKEMNKFANIIRDLNSLAPENPAMTSGHLVPENTVKHQPSQVFAVHSVSNDSQNEIFTVSNFNDSDYPRFDAANYYIKFPKGEWIEIVNTDDKRYDGSGNFKNTEIISSDGVNNSSIKLAGLSTCIFKRIA